MIFIALGTQKFQFNRLIKDIDELVGEGIIREPVFAQIGNSFYEPKNYSWVKFLDPTEFKNKINDCEIFITHGGVGSIHNGLTFNKKVIVYPRLAIYNEHIDDHQIEITEKYFRLGFVLMCRNKNELKKSIVNIREFHPKPFELKSDLNVLEDSIVKYINGESDD